MPFEDLEAEPDLPLRLGWVAGEQLELASAFAGCESEPALEAELARAILRFGDRRAALGEPAQKGEDAGLGGEDARPRRRQPPMLVEPEERLRGGCRPEEQRGADHPEQCPLVAGLATRRACSSARRFAARLSACRQRSHSTSAIAPHAATSPSSSSARSNSGIASAANASSSGPASSSPPQ